MNCRALNELFLTRNIEFSCDINQQVGQRHEKIYLLSSTKFVLVGLDWTWKNLRNFEKKEKYSITIFMLAFDT